MKYIKNKAVKKVWIAIKMVGTCYVNILHKNSETKTELPTNKKIHTKIYINVWKIPSNNRNLKNKKDLNKNNEFIIIKKWINKEYVSVRAN